MRPKSRIRHRPRAAAIRSHAVWSVSVTIAKGGEYPGGMMNSGADISELQVLNIHGTKGRTICSLWMNLGDIVDCRGKGTWGFSRCVPASGTGTACKVPFDWHDLVRTRCSCRRLLVNLPGTVAVKGINEARDAPQGCFQSSHHIFCSQRLGPPKVKRRGTSVRPF